MKQAAAGPIRAWTDADDVTALTALLHLAYKPLLDAGTQYLTGRQDDVTTLRRIGGGRLCWVIDEPALVASSDGTSARATGTSATRTGT